MVLPRPRPNDPARVADETRPSWVGLVGLFSVALGLLGVVLALMAASSFGPLRDARDVFNWALSGGLMIAPLLFAYCFVLTIVRSDAAGWRRGRALFLGLILYLALALFGLHLTS